MRPPGDPRRNLLPGTPLYQRHRRGGRSGLSALLLLTFVPVLLPFVACSPERGDRSPAAPAAASPYSYLLSTDGLREVDPAAMPTTRQLLPWTSQVAVVDMCSAGSTVYLGINRVGLGVVNRGAEEPEIGLITDRRFAERTLRQVFLHDGLIHCHLYRDTVLATGTTPTTPGAALVAYEPRTGRLTDVLLPFQREHPAWEATALVRSAPDAWLLTWKQTTNGGVEYRRQRYDTTTGDTEDLDLETYQRAYAFRDVGRVPKPLAKLLRRVSIPAGAVVHVTVEGPDMSVPHRYRDGDAEELAAGSAELVHIQARRHESTWYLLTPRRILRARNSGEVLSSIELPTLPDDTVYTGLAVASGYAVAAWEQRAFPLVGRAGFVIVDLFP